MARHRRDEFEFEDDDRPVRQTTTVVVSNGGGFPFFIHLLLTVLTCGMWLPVMILMLLIHALTGGK